MRTRVGDGETSDRGVHWKKGRQRWKVRLEEKAEGLRCHRCGDGVELVVARPDGCWVGVGERRTIIDPLRDIGNTLHRNRTVVPVDQIRAVLDAVPLASCGIPL